MRKMITGLAAALAVLTVSAAAPAAACGAYSCGGSYDHVGHGHGGYYGHAGYGAGYSAGYTQPGQ